MYHYTQNQSIFSKYNLLSNLELLLNCSLTTKKLTILVILKCFYQNSCTLYIIINYGPYFLEKLEYAELIIYIDKQIANII